MKASASLLRRCACSRIAGVRAWAWLMVVVMMTSLSAQGDGAREFLIQNWTRDDGLTGNTVTAVAQTPNGYLWVGTLNGLARFDGVRFVAIDLRKLAGQRDPSVFSLHVGRQGDLWIGMGDGHLIRFSHGEFTAQLPPSRQTGDRYIQRMAEDGAGGLWTLNFEGGVNQSTGSVFKEVSTAHEVLALIPSAAGGVWAASRGELLKSEGSQLKCVWDESHEPGFQLESLAPAHEGGCWMAGNGLIRRFEGGEVRETRAKIQEKHATVTGFLEDREGNIWLGSYGGGIMVFDKDGISKRLTREQGLPSDLVRCLFEDREGNLWAGLEAKGLVRIRRAMFASYGRMEGSSDETVLCMCEGEAGEVWIGTNGDGVYRIRNGEVRHYGAKDGLANQFVWALHLDRNRKLWAGTWGGGLFRLEGERFLETSQEFGQTPVVLALHEDSKGRLWLGQRTAPKRVIEAIEEGRRRTFTVPGDLPRMEVRVIADTPDGGLWFGTVEEGLLRLKDGSFTRCDTRLGLPTDDISAITVDDEGDMWVAASGVGLVLWEKERFVPIAATRGLFGANLNQITDDGLGYLWCGSRSGVVRLKKESLRRAAHNENERLDWQRFTKGDGLPSSESSGSGRRTRDGRIWFPTLTGVAVVNPRHVTSNESPPAVLVEEAFLNGSQIFSGDGVLEESKDGKKFQKTSLASREQISRLLRIPPGGGQLDISYTALNFTAPERLRFRYQLTGLKDSTAEVGSMRVARYSYLPPGKYEFRVTACNEGGDWNMAGASLAFEVLPHYWQTWWFQLAGICVVLGTTASTARLVITRRLRRRMAALEQQHALEAERSRIAQDLHDDLGTSLTEINFLSAIAGNRSSSPTDVKVSLDSINDKSLKLVRALDEIVWAVNPKNDSLRNLVNYLCLFAQDYLKPTAIQCRLDVATGLPDLPLNAEERHTLFLVTKEALANAAKHSAASEVWLRVSLKDSHLILIVEDNGQGINPAFSKPGRNGLTNMETRMEQLSGRATVSSKLGKGTRVELALPVR